MKYLLILSMTLLPMSLYAGEGLPVQHDHGARSHSHPLPEAGRNHTHGSQKKPVPTAKQHSHGSRSHSHILPSTGTNHSHSESKKPTMRKAREGWTSFSSSSSHWIDYKNYSYKQIKNKAGEEIAVMIFQWTSKKTSNVTVEKSYVSQKDCLRGYGTVVYTKLDGTYKMESEFAEGGSSVNTSVARVICEVVKKNHAKSI